MWVGQSVDTSVLTSGSPALRNLPMMVSTGCAIRRPSLLRTKFSRPLCQTLSVSGPIMADSGGFVLMKNPTAKWSISTLNLVYKATKPDLVVSLDIPPIEADSSITRRNKRRRTYRNLDQMLPEYGKRLVPVVHGQSLEEIARNCDAIRKRIECPAFIGLGGIVPLLNKSGSFRKPGSSTPQLFLGRALARIKQFFPDSCIHVFGVGAMQTMIGLFALGAGSSDSIGWRQAAGFGSIYLPGTNQRLLSWKKSGTKAPRPFVNKKELKLLSLCNCPTCDTSSSILKRIQKLDSGFAFRAIHNLWVLNEEVRTFGNLAETSGLQGFLESRLSPAWLSAIDHQRLDFNSTP